MDNTELILKTAVEHLYKKKGEEIRILKVDDITVMADYFVICTGNSNTQIKALAGEVEYQLGEMGIEPLHTEGYGSSDWVLLDYGSVIVHVFYKTTRDHYNLERLWADGTEIPFTDFVTPEEDKKDEI
ncbi:MAG: ribosome silencing factor [Clostridia bacterium]|nr:ribosome silencing factor [Clostridia bacterium]